MQFALQWAENSTRIIWSKVSNVDGKIMYMTTLNKYSTYLQNNLNNVTTDLLHLS